MEQYVNLFRSQRQLVDSHSVPLLNAQRDAAFDTFRRQGFPSTRVERYRYTDVAAAFAPDYGLNLGRVDVPLGPHAAFRCDVPNLSTHLVQVVNDQPRLPADDIPFVTTLSRAASQHPDLLARCYNRQAAASGDGITALNTLFAQDGLLVYVPRRQRMERPLQVVNLLRAAVPMMANRRVLVVLDEGAEARLLFCDHALDRQSFLTTQVVEVCVGDGARLDLYEVEETHTLCRRFSQLYVQVGRDAAFSHHSVTLFNGLTRNTTDVRLLGENAQVTLNGCVVADKHQHVDNNTLIDHRVPRCTSHQLYKYVLDDAAVGAFAGRVLVRPDAQKTTSQETNANLCASPQARMYTQPMLEIYADDVKCAHGSTVGVLDQQALFYMRQRGIDEAEARLLLKNAFVAQVVEAIRLEPLRDRLHHLVEKRFRGELDKCTGCALCK